jgi:hypothetical protein
VGELGGGFFEVWVFFLFFGRGLQLHKLDDGLKLCGYLGVAGRDVAVASDLDFKFSSHLGLLLGDGVGRFSALPLLPASDGNVRDIALGDFNNDGALDAVLSDQSFGRVLVFLSEP